MVSGFYQRDDITRIAPGKRDTITVPGTNGKEKLQKWHLFMHIKEAYALFKDEYPNVKIGVSKFAMLRPFQALLSSKVTSNICTCIYHQNIFLSLDATHIYLPTIPTYDREFAAACLV